jgi:hypothetical protein
MGGIEDSSLNRAFTPSGLSVRTVKDSAIFKWNMPVYGNGKVLNYTLELAKDSLFSNIDYSVVTDTTGAVILDPDIALNTRYFYRVKVNEYKGAAPSMYLNSLTAFRLTGQQYFRVIRDFEITENRALFHWYQNANTAALTKIVLTPGLTNPTPITVEITGLDIASGIKNITGLTPDTKYMVQLFAGDKSKGILNITTAKPVVFTTILSPTDNLATAITTAANGDVIGLNPGTYNLTGITYITQKSITIRSVANDPTTTKIKSREINLVGDSAGVSLAGIEFDGNYSGTSYGTTFMQLFGTQAITNAKAAFKAIKIENCIIHDYLRCILRGNYGAAANDQKIESVSINNTRIYNVDQTNVQGYYMFSLEKLLISKLSFTKSTLYNLGQGMINMGTNLSSSIIPLITLDYCTFNNFGGNNKYVFIDANANKIVFTFNNSIVANTPISGAIQAAAFRASATGNTLAFSNNNYFNLKVAGGGPAVNLTGLAQANDISIDLGWTAATTNFKLVDAPEFSKVFSASSNGSTIGDPRWAY